MSKDRYESPEDEIARLAAEQEARERIQANREEQERIAEAHRRLNEGRKGWSS